MLSARDEIFESVYVSPGEIIYTRFHGVFTSSDSRGNGFNLRDGARSAGSAELESTTRHRRGFQKTPQLLNAANNH